MRARIPSQIRENLQGNLCSRDWKEGDKRECKENFTDPKELVDY